MELLYLSPPSSLKPPYNTAAALLETAAHELQHLIYFNRKYLLNNNTSASENPYITEGLSHLAQDLSGYQAGNLYVLWSSLKGVGQLSVPNLGSNEITGYVPAADGLMRGGGYLLLRYLFDQAGGDAMDSAGKPLDRGGIAWLRKFSDSKELGTTNYVNSSGLKQETLISQFWTAMALSNRGSSGGALSTDKRYNFLPISSDPLTSRQRGCNLFTRFHSFQLTGPDSATFDRADGSLLAGGAEFLTLSPASGQKTLSFSISTTPEARALARLIRLE
jgi:hypothetical protein